MNNLIINVVHKGVVSMKYLFDSGWSYVLPNPAYRVFEIIKQHQGENVMAFPSYNRIEMMTGVHAEDIRTSIEFLSLIGFITYLSADRNASRNSNNYYSNNIPHIAVMELLKPQEFLINQIKETRVKRSRPNDIQKFDDNVQKMTNINKEFIEQKVKPLRPCWNTVKTEDYTANKNTFNLIRDFLQALYSAMRVSKKQDEVNYNQNNLLTFIQNLDTHAEGVGHSPQVSKALTPSEQGTHAGGIEYTNEKTKEYITEETKDDDAILEVDNSLNNTKNLETKNQSHLKEIKAPDFETDYRFNRNQIMSELVEGMIDCGLSPAGADKLLPLINSMSDDNLEEAQMSVAEMLLTGCYKEIDDYFGYFKTMLKNPNYDIAIAKSNAYERKQERLKNRRIG